MFIWFWNVGWYIDITYTHFTLISSTLLAVDTKPEPRVPPIYSHLVTTSPPAPHSTVHASQSQQQPHPDRVPIQPHIQTKYAHITTAIKQAHNPSVKLREISILKVNSTSTHYKTTDTDIQYITNIPHRRCKHTLHSRALVHWWPQRTTNSRYQQLRPHNTKHNHTNQSTKHHIITNIFIRYHHGV